MKGTTKKNAVQVILLVTGLVLAFTVNSLGAVTLDVMVSAGNTAQVRAWQSIGRAFSQEHPDIRIQFMFLAPLEIEEKLLVASAGGVSVDAVYWVTSFYSKFAGRGFLKDLTPYIDGDFRDRFIPGLMNGVTHEDRVFGLPAVASSQALLFNEELFGLGGVPWPDSADDWDDFLDKMRKLTIDRDGDGQPDQWGFTWFAALAREWLNWVWQNDGDLFSEDGSEYILDRPAAVEAVQYLADLSLVHRVAPPGVMLRGPIWETFFNGQSAVYPSGAWDAFYINSVDEQMTPINVAHYPRGKQAAVAVDMFVVSIPEVSEHPDEAALFAKWLAGSDRGQELLYEAGWGVPAVLDVARHTWVQPGSRFRGEVFLEAFEWGRFVPHGRNWAEVESALMPALSEILDGNVDAAVGLSQLKPQIDAIIQR